jgi:SET domain-containing protein
MKSLIQNNVVVKKSKTHGYGVFARKKIKKGDIIEQCYILISRRGGDKALEDYYFDAKGKYAIFTGFGIIYNHADEPNADYTINITKRIATIKAKKNIKKDAEIFVTYGDKWFSSRGLTAKKVKL